MSDVMPAVLSCSACGRRLKVRDALLGARVRCPFCGETFTATRKADSDDKRGDRDASESSEETYAVQTEASPGPSRPSRPMEEGPEPLRRRRRRPVSAPGDEVDDGRDIRPHRGPLILILGILSVVLSCIPLAGWVLGAMSMSMGSNDERLMEDRWMDRSGRGMTKAGQICGIFGVFFASVVFILALFLRVSRIVRF
jgi:predicted RNA-binding Zn-ribbon protein involved in translation (DUF1610 family)